MGRRVWLGNASEAGLLEYPVRLIAVGYGFFFVMFGVEEDLEAVSGWKSFDQTAN